MAQWPSRRGRLRLGVARLRMSPLRGLLGPGQSDAGQSLVALSISATTSLITGLTLAAMTGSFERYPGLLLFIPAAIGLRGNIFGPLGGRLSTSIRTGTFAWSWRIDSVLGQNLLATLASTLVAAIGLAAVAELVVIGLYRGQAPPLGLADFVVISALGGLLASGIVLAITLGLTVASARFGWDLDNVTAPIVSSAGDFVTVPAIVVCTGLIRRGWLTWGLSVGLVALGAALMITIYRSRLHTCRRTLLESLPVLIVAGFLSLLAGLFLEGSLDRLLRFSVLLVLLPGFLTTGGALGGILSSRLATKFHLGLIDRSLIPTESARSDLFTTGAIAVPIFTFLAVVASIVGHLAGRTSPGVGLLVAVALTAGMVATAVVAVVSYYGTMAVVRFGLDPDNLGIPLVSASLDMVGALTLLGAVWVWGVA